MKTWADYKHELIKYRKYIFTTPKLMWLNEGKLECIKKIFQVISPSYHKYLILDYSLNLDHSLFEDYFWQKIPFWKPITIWLHSFEIDCKKACKWILGLIQPLGTFSHHQITHKGEGEEQIKTSKEEKQ